MTARMRRIAADCEQLKKDFANHKYITVSPIGPEPAEKYHVTYFVNGIYLQPDGRIETLGRHEVEITLHADYPRYKPVCKILTPIWHPNFRDGQICIGDIWGAGESLTDIIINIGDMIQYKSWNSSSPLSADAADWALKNKHLFPVGMIDLYIADSEDAAKKVEIELFNESGKKMIEDASVVDAAEDHSVPIPAEKENELDFVITADELEGIEFVPSAQRMQAESHTGTVKAKINFKTVLTKGVIWAVLGAFVGFGISELADGLISENNIASMQGDTHLADYYNYSAKSEKAFGQVTDEYEKYCNSNGIDSSEDGEFLDWYLGLASENAKSNMEKYLEFDEKANDALVDSFKYEYNSDEDDLEDAIASITRKHTGLWSALIAIFIGLFLGIGEGYFYGSKNQAIKYGAIGAAVSIIMGYISGYLAQKMYGGMMEEDSSLFASSLIRGIGWAIMGIGAGIAVGFIKPEKKRLIFCTIGGAAGAFVGGFLFNYVCKLIPDDMIARGVAIVIMGSLIGIGVGLLEQFAKQAWLKVIRGEFEGKEYLVFNGTTSIGNNSKNTIVLFKDKSVAEHHCDIVLEGSRYVLKDSGTPSGTLVNGQRVIRPTILRQGDAISVGNSVLVFNTK